MRIVALDVGSSSVRAVAYDEHGEAEPGDAHLAYDDLDADRLVAACRTVLAHVGEGDELAVSCFWHSLLPVDERDRPLSPGRPTIAARGASSTRRTGRRSSCGCRRRACARRATSRSATTCCCD
jgi:sugar (pentulose or hexulose) kinase